jgi:hypothetical protein
LQATDAIAPVIVDIGLGYFCMFLIVYVLESRSC